MSDPSMISSLTFKPATDAAKAGFEALAPTAQRSDLAKLIGERISSSGLSMPWYRLDTAPDVAGGALFGGSARHRREGARSTIWLERFIAGTDESAADVVLIRCCRGFLGATSAAICP